MSNHKQRAVRIGIALNSPGNGSHNSIAEQYTTSNRVLHEMTQALTQLGGEVIKIEGDSGFYQSLSALADEVDVIFNKAEDIYQITVPMAVAQVNLEQKQQTTVCTGATVEGHVLALNKSLARRMLVEKVPQPQWWYLKPNEYPEPGVVHFPVLVKPASEGHSLGVADANVVYALTDLQDVLNKLWSRFNTALLVESYLDGMEYSMGIVGNVVSPAVAWDLSQLPGKPLVRGEDLKQQDLTIPHAKLVSDPILATAIAEQVIRAHIGLGLQDFSRSDFRAKQGELVPCYIETNSSPGLVKGDSVLPWSSARAGVAYEDLIGSIIFQALKRLPEGYHQQLHIQGFEDAYQRVCSLASHSITVEGQEYHLLLPRTDGGMN